MVGSISSIRFVSELAVSVCAAFVAFYRVKYSSAAVIRALGPSLFKGKARQRQHILPSYFKTPSVVVVWGFNSQLPAQQEHLCDVERNDTSTSKPVARQSNLLNHFPYIQAVQRSAKLQTKDLPFRSALFILTVSTNAFHSANLFLFSHHHIPTNSEAPFSSFKYTHNSQLLQPL